MLENEFNEETPEDLSLENYADGYIEKENRLAKLLTTLFASGRTEDAEKALMDMNFREKLYAELNL